MCAIRASRFIYTVIKSGSRVSTCRRCMYIYIEGNSVTNDIILLFAVGQSRRAGDDLLCR